jgi:hypothetical protein
MGNIHSSADADNKGYKAFTEQEPLTLYNDGCYTAYMEYAYSGDRLLLDTIVYDPETGLPYSKAEPDTTISDPEPDPDLLLRRELKVDKVFEIKGYILPWGTKLTLIDLDTNTVYVYTVTDETGSGGSGLASVSLSKFKNMLTGENYKEKDLADEVQLPKVKTAYTLISESGKVISDPNAGLERCLMVVDFNKAADTVSSTGILRPRLWMATDEDGYTADKGTYGISKAYDALQPYLTINKRRSLSINQTGRVNTFSREIPLTVGLELKDLIYEGYDFSKDLINKTQPYLEVSYAITSDEAGKNVMELSQGTMVYYGASSDALTKNNTGQILFMMDQGIRYDMGEHNVGGQLSTVTNISLTLDFSHALQFNFEVGKTYWMKVSLYRVAESELGHPLNGKPIQTLMIPIRVETDRRYGFRIDAERKQLNVNLLGKDDEEKIPDLSFTSRFSNGLTRVKEQLSSTACLRKTIRVITSITLMTIQMLWPSV